MVQGLDSLALFLVSGDSATSNDGCPERWSSRIGQELYDPACGTSDSVGERFEAWIPNRVGKAEVEDI